MATTTLTDGSGRRALAICAVVLASVPLVAGPYFLAVMVDVGLYSIVTLGLVLLMGFAGQVSLGQGVFFGLGAYGYGILTTQYDVSPWAALLVAVVVAGAVAAGVGRVVLRLRGLIIAGVTLTVNLIFYYLCVNVSDLTGGATGMALIPRLPSGELMSPSLFTYYLVWAVGILLLMFSLNLVKSRVGRALRAMNALSGGSEDTAQVLGVNIMRYKVEVFTVAAIYAGIAGGIYAHYTSCIEPGAFGVQFSVLVAIMAIVGGLTSPWGGFLGAGLMVGLTQFLREVMPVVVGGPTGAYELVAYGVILVATLLFMPQGLVSICGKVERRVRMVVASRRSRQAGEQSGA